jgi:hypothetical protein
LQQPNSKALSRTSHKIFVSTALGCCGLMFDAGILLCKGSHSIFVSKGKNDMFDVMAWQTK